MNSLIEAFPRAVARVNAVGLPMLDRLSSAPGFAKVAARAGLVGGSLAGGSLFWARASLGQNQLTMHHCDDDGVIGIGGVSEQFFSEGFIPVWHEVLGREVGERAAGLLYEVGVKGARWEVEEAVRHGVWVPRLLRGLIGRPELLVKVRESAFMHALLKESLLIIYRMIMKEGGWGVVEEIDLRQSPAKIVVHNTPESRQIKSDGGPVCHIARGIYTGYLATIFGVEAKGAETSCRARGDRRCTFEITLAG